MRTSPSRNRTRMHGVLPKPPDGDALDALEAEDRELLEALTDFETDPDQHHHGTAGKRIVEHLAVRLAAREELAAALSDAPGYTDVVGELRSGEESWREYLTRLDELARGVGPMDLNTGQDFDGVVLEKACALEVEVRTEVAELIPELRRRVGRDGQTPLPSARRATRHARLRPGGRRGAGTGPAHPLRWLASAYDWVRRLPPSNSQE
jgi:hypothetical protein